ncbi:MAG: cupin domain-containing protein [Thermoleophilia bacterium]
MAGTHTLVNLHDVPDAAAGGALSEFQEARFARAALQAADTGLAYHRLRPGKRQGFAHRHDKAEELHVVLSGEGTVTVDGEVVALKPMDALRIAPEAVRIFEAGPDGMEFLVFGPHHEGDGEIVKE